MVAMRKAQQRTFLYVGIIMTTYLSTQQLD